MNAARLLSPTRPPCHAGMLNSLGSLAFAYSFAQVRPALCGCMPCAGLSTSGGSGCCTASTSWLTQLGMPNSTGDACSWPAVCLSLAAPPNLSAFIHPSILAGAGGDPGYPAPAAAGNRDHAQGGGGGRDQRLCLLPLSGVHRVSRLALHPDIWFEHALVTVWHLTGSVQLAGQATPSAWQALATHSLASACLPAHLPAAMPHWAALHRVKCWTVSTMPPPGPWCSPTSP